MVDAAMSFRSQPASVVAPALKPQGSGSGLAVSVLPETDLVTYGELARRSLRAPAQDPLWIEEWVANVEPDGFVAVVEQNGRAVYALALEVVRTGPFRIARFMSGRHANGNFPAADPAFLKAEPFDTAALLAAIR